MYHTRLPIIVLALACAALCQAGQPPLDVIDIGSSLLKHSTKLKVQEKADWIVQMPKGSHSASITDGPTSSDIFVCTLVKSAVYHVDLSTNTTHMIYQDTSADPIPINGCVFDKRYNAIWASGSISGIVRVIYVEPAGATYKVKKTVDVTVVKGPKCRPLQPCPFLLNEVAVGDKNVFVSDSFQPHLYALPRDVSDGSPVKITKLPLGPKFHCVGPCMAPLSEKANGVAVVDDTTLIVSHWGLGNVFKVSLAGLKVTGVHEIQLPVVNDVKIWADGMVMVDRHTAYMGNNFGQSVLRLDFNDDHTAAEVGCILSPKVYSVPTNVVVKGDMVWAANSHYLKCVPSVADCSKQTYEVIGMNATSAC